MHVQDDIRLIYYCTAGDPSGDRLRRVIEMNFSRDHVETYRSVGMLSMRLREPTIDRLILVILAASHEELTDLLTLRDLLLGQRIILVLPDDHEDTTSRGHQLRPRFITYSNSDYVEVSVVLGKMIRAGVEYLAGNLPDNH